MSNVIDMRYLRNGYYKDKVRVISDVPLKQGEGLKAYVKRVVNDANVIDAVVERTGGLKDKGDLR